MKSLLKWAGAKPWVVRTYAHLLPPLVTTSVYREPFLGSGGVAAHYMGKVSCCLSDSNARLMAMYRGVRDDPAGVIAELKQLRYDPEVFYHVRALFNERRDARDTSVAAWMIYLNRTCFNAVYRENRAGAFNVPIGAYKDPKFCDEEAIAAWSTSLSAEGVVLTCESYEKSLFGASAGDVVFFDPPYVPASKTANHTKYTSVGFGPEDQVRLVWWLEELHRRGVRWMLTNSAEARGLYEHRPDWHIVSVQRPRNVNSKGTARGMVNEIIVMNYELAA